MDVILSASEGSAFSYGAMQKQILRLRLIYESFVKVAINHILFFVPWS